MSTSALHAELVKLRRAPIWMACVMLPLIAAAIGTFNYQSNLGILEDGWFDLWTQHTLFEGMFFLHALVGATCSWLMRLEHQGTNWNQLLASPVRTARLMGAKLVVGWGMLGVALLSSGMLFVVCGKAVGLPGLPRPEHLLWLALAWVGGLAVVACQLFVSLLVRNFAAPVGIAAIGGLSGFLLSAYGHGLVSPYALLVLGLNSNGHGGVTPSQIPAFLVASGAFSIGFLCLAAYVLSSRDDETS